MHWSVAGWAGRDVRPAVMAPATTVMPMERPKKELPAWVSVVAVCSTTVARRNVHTASMNRARPSPSGPAQPT